MKDRRHIQLVTSSGGLAVAYLSRYRGETLRRARRYRNVTLASQARIAAVVGLEIRLRPGPFMVHVYPRYPGFYAAEEHL